MKLNTSVKEHWNNERVNPEIKDRITQIPIDCVSSRIMKLKILSKEKEIEIIQISPPPQVGCQDEEKVASIEKNEEVCFVGIQGN